MYKAIVSIVPQNIGDAITAAARKAGAGGGTILSARGTAKEGDAKFFGVEIVPEKDMLIILVPSEKKSFYHERSKTIALPPEIRGRNRLLHGSGGFHDFGESITVSAHMNKEGCGPPFVLKTPSGHRSPGCARTGRSLSCSSARAASP